ncbi:hypothetical protein [Geodermatophilus sp. URMC 62]|uniref:hypothetical protein n=1 Tax=Geodermatophilus sp. URMC 62 TaxID=3423414 RepID=UPI00406C134F
MSGSPRWRQAYDAVEAAVSPRAESVVRSEGFATGVLLVQRAQGLARSSARGLSARAWHLLNLPAGSDVRRLRTQIGALDREVRRLTLQLEGERRRTTDAVPRTEEETRADGADAADHPRARSAGRRAQRAAGS